MTPVGCRGLGRPVYRSVHNKSSNVKNDFPFLPQFFPSFLEKFGRSTAISLKEGDNASSYGCFKIRKATGQGKEKQIG